MLWNRSLQISPDPCKGWRRLDVGPCHPQGAKRNNLEESWSGIFSETTRTKLRFKLASLGAAGGAAGIMVGNCEVFASMFPTPLSSLGTQKTLYTLLNPKVAGRIQKTSVLPLTRVMGAVLTLWDRNVPVASLPFGGNGKSSLHCRTMAGRRQLKKCYFLFQWQGKRGAFLVGHPGDAVPSSVLFEALKHCCLWVRWTITGEQQRANSLQEGTVLQLALTAVQRQQSALETRVTCILGEKNATVHLGAFGSVKGLFVSVHLMYPRLRLNTAHEEFHVSETSKYAVTFLVLYLRCRYLKKKKELQGFLAAAFFAPTWF